MLQRQQLCIQIHKQGHESDSDCNSSGISIADYRSQLPWVAGGGITIEGTNRLTQVEIDYPVTQGPFRFPINSQPLDSSGYTMRELVNIACEAYQQMYTEEDHSSSIKAGQLGNTYNRNQTNGTYGIWGHEITDLSLTELLFEPNGNTLYLEVDS